MPTDNRFVDISVLMMTYYHERFVAKALDSIIRQQTDLTIEILIGDDGSGDKTQDIIKSYAERYPELIVAVLRPENIGASRNYADMLQRARGKYIAPLEGDDYWIDVTKLQKQWDFLEGHPEYIGCGGKCIIVDEHDRPNYYRSPHFVHSKKVFTIDDLVECWDLPVQAGTMMFRNVFRGMAPEDYSILYKAHRIVGDKTLMLMLLARGPFYCSNEVLACYRFVIKKGGHNWFSIHHANKYWQYDGFMYPCRVESWARKALGLRSHLGNRKDYHFCSFVEAFCREPSMRRLRYIIEMICHSHQPLKYSAYIIKAMIEKE